MMMGAAFWGLMTLSAPVLSAEKVDIRAGEHPTYGRLVFDWGRAVKAAATVDGGYLVVRFEKPFSADLAKVSRDLDGYVGAGEFQDDGRTARFPLKGNFDLKTSSYGTVFVVDLKKGAGAKAAPAVKVRSGNHASFSRLVFDWPTQTGFSVQESGNGFVLSFDKAGSLDTAAVSRRLPDRLTGLKASTADGRTEVTVQTRGPVEVKSFRSGNSIAFDFSDEVPRAENTPSAKVIASKPAKDAGVQETGSAASAGQTTANAANTAAAEKPMPAVTAAPVAPVKAQPVAPRSLVPAQTAKPAAQQAVTPQGAGADVLTVSVGKLKDGFRLIFPWQQSTGMALFERAGAYWLIFDQKITLDFDALEGPYKLLVMRRKQLPHATATLARLDIRDGYAPAVARVGNEWQIDFRLGEAPVIEHLVDVQRQPASRGGARVFIPAVNNGDRITFEDPEAGDELVAIPLYSPSWGLDKIRLFSQFQVLPSVQGIALDPKDPSVVVEVERNGVVISADGGLQLSRTISREDLFADGDQTDRFSQQPDQAQLVRLNEWAQVSSRDFWDRKQLLQRKVARSPGPGRNAARMELAKFLVAHDFHADALGVLARIQADDPRADEDSVYRLLRGLSNLGMNHTEKAREDLFHPAFNGISEVAPWRAIAAGQQEDWKTARREILDGKPAFGVYNQDRQNRFHLLEAEAALADYDIERAMAALASLKVGIEGKTDPALLAKREYLEGVAAVRAGNLEEGILKFEQAMSYNIPPIEARARFEKVNAELAQGVLTTDEAIDAFKQMDFSWRGDGLELEIRKRIGDLLIATGRYSEGLEVFRSIVSTFPESPRARDIAREMNDLFNRLFLEGEADSLPPIKALALYYEYRELTPLGRKGDEMIRKLSDRLVEIDLLEQAAQLLDHQVNFRLKGEQKALTGTKLAAIHLWDGQPQEALNVLKKTRWRLLKDSVKQERLHIQSRAYAELADYEEALALLTEDKSEKADRLRLEIHWQAKDWPNTIKALEALLSRHGATGNAALSNEDRQLVMQLAVARSLANDAAGLAAMRKTYRAKIAETPDRDAFDLITDTTGGADVNFRERSSAIAKIGQLEGFMSSYREQLQNGEFWATN